jgi:hypothetical protein
MARRSLGTLTVDLIARTGGFVQGMDKAERASAKRLKAIQKNFEVLGKAAGIGISAATTALAGLTVSTASAAKEIQKFAAISQATTTEFQRFAVGAERVGISQEKLADIFKDVNDRVGDFLVTGAGPLADFFETVAPKIGVTADQLKGLSGPEALQFLVSSLQNANASSQEFTFFLEAIASDATALAPLLLNNGELLNQFGDEAQRAGAILEEDLVKQAASLADAFNQSRLQVKGFSLDIAEETIPVLNDLVDAFFGVQTESRNFAQIASVVPSVLRTVAQAAVLAASTFEVLGKGIGTTAAAFAALSRQEGEGFFSTAPLKRAANVLEVAREDLATTIEKYQNLLTDVSLAGRANPLEGIGESAKTADVKLRELQQTLREVTGTGVGTAGIQQSEQAVQAEQAPTNFPVIDFTDDFLTEEQETFEVALKQREQTYQEHKNNLVAIEEVANSQLSGAARQLVGEQSGIYQALFAIEKGASIARSIIAIQTALAQASASGPFPANLAAMASVASATAGLVSTIASTTIQGQAHDGLMSVPKTGTYLLEKGERVTTAETSAKLDQKLDGMGGGVRIINSIDPGLMNDFLGSSQGEKTIMNVIRKNQRTVSALASA